MGFAAERGNQTSYPGFQTFEADPGVVGLAGLVIGPAHDQVVGRARARLEAHIVVGIERIPIEASFISPRGMVNAIA
jgi:hypothetical protein